MHNQDQLEAQLFQMDNENPYTGDQGRRPSLTVGRPLIVPKVVLTLTDLSVRVQVIQQGGAPPQGVIILHVPKGTGLKNRHHCITYRYFHLEEEFPSNRSTLKILILWFHQYSMNINFRGFCC